MHLRALLLVAALPIVACGPSTPAATATPTAASATPTATASASTDAPATTTDLPSPAGSGQPLAKVDEKAGEPKKDDKKDDKNAKASEPGRTADDIKAAIQAKRPEARACYDEGAKKNPAIAEGDLVVNFFLAADGAVKNLEIDPQRTQISDAAVGACVIKVLSTLSFPKSAKGFETRASYPFNFRKKTVAPH